MFTTSFVFAIALWTPKVGRKCDARQSGVTCAAQVLCPLGGRIFLAEVVWQMNSSIFAGCTNLGLRPWVVGSCFWICVDIALSGLPKGIEGRGWDMGWG